MNGDRGRGCEEPIHICHLDFVTEVPELLGLTWTCTV